MAHSTILFSVASLADLDDIYDFHSSRNPRYAAELYARLTDAARSLASHPERGAALRHRQRSLRRLIEERYAIIYEPGDGAVMIARILHAARDIETILSDES